MAGRFMALRSPVGAALVRAWARERLPVSAAILDLGCGSGIPIARALADDGFAIWGIDASPTLVAAYRRNLPAMPVACEAVQDSPFFGRRFAGVVAVGLVFLLDPMAQRALLAKVAAALEPGGRFLFSAPRVPCRWSDTLTGRPSESLGAEAYARMLADLGLGMVDGGCDEGGNAYHDVRKPAG